MYKKLLLVGMLMGFCWMQAHIQEAFSLFKMGEYQQATQLMRISDAFDVLNARDQQGHTLLIAAVVYSDTLDAVYSAQEKYYLVEEALDCILHKVEFNILYIDRQDSNRQTALIHAAQKGNYAVAEYLYIHNANPRIEDRYRKTARDYVPTDYFCQALLSWEWEALEMMRDAENAWRLLRYGMYRPFLAFVVPHLSDLECISMRDRLGNSLIMALIVFSYSIYSVSSYLEKEDLILSCLNQIYDTIADQDTRDLLLDVQNQQGQTALMWAAKYGHERVIHWLHDRGADMLLQDKYGRRSSDYVIGYKQLKDQLADWEVEQEIGWRCNMRRS